MKSELDNIKKILPTSAQNGHKQPTKVNSARVSSPNTPVPLRIFNTTLHLKQTKSSICKSNTKPLKVTSLTPTKSPTPSNGSIKVKDTVKPAKPRILQRQRAIIHQNSKESLNGDRDLSKTKDKISVNGRNGGIWAKNGDPDGCDSRKRCVTTTTNNGESDRHNDNDRTDELLRRHTSHGHLRLVKPKISMFNSQSGLEEQRIRSRSNFATKPEISKSSNGIGDEKRRQCQAIAKSNAGPGLNHKKQLEMANPPSSTPLHNGDKEKEKFTFKSNKNKTLLTNGVNEVGVVGARIQQPELNNNDINCPILEALIALKERKRTTERTGRKKSVEEKQEMGSNQTTVCCRGGGVGVKSGGGGDEPVQFVVPLEPHVEVVEGSELELWVKIKGARKVVWVKNDQLLPHAPPDLVYNCNPVEGIYSLRIKDVFLQDSGVYVCEAYGDSVTSDRICYCTVQVIEDFEDDESSVDVVVVEAPKRKLIVPLIITTSDNSHMDDIAEEQDTVHDRRNYYATCSSHSSRESYEDALEDIHEVPDEEEECTKSLEADLFRNLEMELENQVFEPEVVEPSEPLANVLEVVSRAPETTPNKASINDSQEKVPEMLQDPLTPEHLTERKILTEKIAARGLQSQASTESGGSDACHSSASLDDKDFDVSGSSVECNSGYMGTFRDSLSDNPLSPKFLMGPSNLIVMLGEVVNLRVKIWTTEDSNTTVTWCKLVRGIYQQLDTASCSDSHVEITQPTNDLVTLKISNANYEDSGKYKVKIQNSHGADYHHCLVSVEGPPEPPATPPTAIHDELNRNINISWPCCPFDGGSAISCYILETKLKPKPTSTCDCQHESWMTITSSDFKGLCYTLKNPKSSHIYYFRVCVENSHGKGKYSKTSDEICVGESLEKENSQSEETNTEDAEFYEYQEVALQHKNFLLDYDKHEILGKGRFGVVNKVINKLTQKSYAGKFVRCIKAADKQRAELEYKIMNELKYHPKLICLVDAYEMPREIVIVTEMINGGELFERVVADDFTLTERDCVTFLRQICDGVKYIHDKNIMHLDLKPENILCTQKNSNQIKIIDFGLAQYYNPDEPIRVLFGTAEFVSPEIINYETICPATDMWSVGVITYILLSGLSPFLGDDDNETFSNITRGDFDFDDESFEKISEHAKDFISSLILKRKDKRLTAEDCLNHKWLALSDAEKKDIVLSTDRLKRFLLRRKWQKTGNAIRALGRITTLYSSSRKSSSGSSSVSSPSAFGENRQISTQESLEDSVFAPNNPSTDPTNKDDQEERREDFAQRAKYDESCRSDSGIGGEAPGSGNYSLE